MASKLNQIFYLVVHFTTKNSVPKFPLYDQYFPRYAPKTNLKQNLGAKMWHIKFCAADGGGAFNMLFLPHRLTLFCEVPQLPPKCLVPCFYPLDYIALA